MVVFVGNVLVVMVLVVVVVVVMVGWMQLVVGVRVGLRVVAVELRVVRILLKEHELVRVHCIVVVEEIGVVVVHLVRLLYIACHERRYEQRRSGCSDKASASAIAHELILLCHERKLSCS